MHHCLYYQIIILLGRIHIGDLVIPTSVLGVGFYLDDSGRTSLTTAPMGMGMVILKLLGCRVVLVSLASERSARLRR